MKRILFLLSIGGMLFLSSCQDTPKQNYMTDTLQGKVKRDIIRIAPKIPGRVVKLYVEEGQTVKAGDTLAYIDIPEINAKLEQARAGVFSAQSQYDLSLNGATREQLRQVDAAVKAAEEQMAFAETSFQRIQKMFQDSLIPAQQYDETKMKYQAASAQLEAANAKKDEVYAGVRSEKQKMAQGQLQLARGILSEALIAAKERHLLAPRPMRIETVTLEEGELALAGYTIFTGYAMDEGSLYFRFTVPESKVSGYQLNQTYQLELPFQEKTLKARLVSRKQLASYANKTSSYPQYELGETVYELRLEPTDKSADESIIANSLALLKP